MSETGIPNCTNTCFMNASFQMLYSMEEFRNQIMNIVLEIELDGHDGIDEYITVIKKVKALKKIFELMASEKSWGVYKGTNANAYNEGEPRGELIKAKTELIKLIIGVRGEAVITLGSQQDASNFILKLLGMIYIVEELSDNIGLITGLYRGVEKNDTYCKKNDSTDIVNADPKEQPIDLITLPFNNKKNITEAMKEREKEEQISPDVVTKKKLTKCDKLSETTGDVYNSYQKTSLTIPEANKYIIIALNRFEYDNSKSEFKRVNDPSFNVEHEVNIDGKIYSLTGAVLHSGLTTNSGHYIYQTYDKGNVLKTYNDDSIGNREDGSDDMTLNLNSYVLLYKRLEGEASAPAATSPSSEAVEATPVASSREEASSTPVAPIDQQKGKGKILKIVLKFDNGDEIYEGFKLGKREWVPHTLGGNKKSRKPKSKKIRLRKTRRRKH